jgi:hypothetical protein
MIRHVENQIAHRIILLTVVGSICSKEAYRSEAQSSNPSSTSRSGSYPEFASLDRLLQKSLMLQEHHSKRVRSQICELNSAYRSRILVKVKFTFASDASAEPRNG